MREERTQSRKRRLHVLIFDARAKAEIKAEHQKQYRDGGVEIDQDRNAARERRHTEHELVGVAHHHAGIRKQRLEVAAGDVAEAFQQHRAGRDFAALEPSQLAL